MAKIKITENSPLKIELLRDNGTRRELFRGRLVDEVEDFTVKKTGRRSAEITIGRDTSAEAGKAASDAGQSQGPSPQQET